MLDDYDLLVEKIRETHPNPYHANSKKIWDKTIVKARKQLHNDNPLGIAEFYKLIALLNDSHSRINLQFGPGHGEMQDIPSVMQEYYPFHTYVFSDGVWITKAADTNLLGRKIVKINGIPIKEIAERIRPYMPVENEAGFAGFFPYAVRSPLFFAAADIISDITDVIKVDLENEEVEIRPGKEDLISLLDTTNISLARYWKSDETLSIREENENLIVDIREIADTEKMSMKQLGLKLDEKLQQVETRKKIKRLIIDIRQNGGGNNYLNQEIVHAIIRNRWINHPGKVFCLIDRWTFSAAINMANSLERQTWALFAGEAFSAPINHYGDSTKIELPHTGLIVRISTLYWQDSEPRDQRRAIIPDIHVNLTYNQYIKGEDPVIAAVERFDASEYEEIYHKYTPRYKWLRESQKGKILTYFTS